jgi:6-phosphogluconolactonase/glucosamine-6-phosphate isomerase/deaminase
MEIQIFPDYDALSQAAAAEVIGLIKQKPTAVICVASGNTPVSTCDWIVKKSIEENVDFSQCSFIGLDEWIGITPDNKGSCHYFQQHYLHNQTL